MHVSPKAILAQYGLKPQKHLGQNFLINPLTCQQIVAKGQIGPSDVVVEIGAGLGSLTLPLSQRAKQVIAIEFDPKLAEILEGILKEQEVQNVKIWIGDALRFNYEAVFNAHGQKIKIVGNLPYQISSPLLFLFLEKRHVTKSLTLMFQKEVAERLMARPRSKKYGLLSVLYGLTAQIHPILKLKPASFYPPPKVGSEVIQIEWRLPAPEIPSSFITFLKRLFGQRRKTILNCLKAVGPKETIERLIRDLGLNPLDRPEVISPQQLLRLFWQLQRSKAVKR